MNTKFSSLFAVASLVCLFGFPKAGIYVSGVPFTFGYLFLAVMAVMQMIQVATQTDALSRLPRITPRFAWLTVLLFTLACVEAASFAIYGSTSLGALVSITVSTLVIPVTAMLAAAWALRVIGIDGLLRSLRWALWPVLVFGLVSFAVYNLSGKVIGIPYITTTGSDLELVAQRHNLRGPVIKMFSTYNNGNILGINLLMWGPLAALLSVTSACGYRSLCVLTLSRSVWAGLLALEVIGAMVQRSYRRILFALTGAVALTIAVVGASIMIGRDPVTFLLDRDLGGRVTSLQQDLEVISHRRIGWDSESAPAAAWLAFGPAGMLLMAAIWALPIIAGGRSRVQVTARISLAVYMIVALVEGAFVLVPTQAVYWFVAALALAPRHQVLLAEEREKPRVESTEIRKAA